MTHELWECSCLTRIDNQDRPMFITFLGNFRVAWRCHKVYKKTFYHSEFFAINITRSTVTFKGINYTNTIRELLFANARYFLVMLSNSLAKFLRLAYVSEFWAFATTFINSINTIRPRLRAITSLVSSIESLPLNLEAFHANNLSRGLLNVNSYY